MAEPRDRERDMSKILSSVEADITGAPAPANIASAGNAAGPSAYAPQRERERIAQGGGVQRIAGAADSLEQIQGDMRRAVQELELRCKAVLDEIKRAVG